jgi:hypothetical protein
MANGGKDARAWMLTMADRASAKTKNGASRLRFAVLLAFYREHGRFPRALEEIDREAVTFVARQIGMEPDDHNYVDMTSRTGKRHRTEIRFLLGFREATVADAAMLEAWLRDQRPTIGVIQDQLIALVETRCRELLIEAPAPDRIDRIVRAAIRTYEERFHASVVNRLIVKTCKRLEALLRPAGEDSATPTADPSTQPAPALLLHLRGDPGRPGLAGVQEALSRLKLVREIALPPGLFDDVLPHELE